MTEFNTIIRPDFLHWAHKALWDMLVKDPEMRKSSALAMLNRLYSTKNVGYPVFECFACQSVCDLDRQANRAFFCQTEKCPLDWSAAGYGTSRDRHGCLETCGTVRSFNVYQLYISARDNRLYEQASRYAAQIRDLPLTQNAYLLYNIKETIND